MSGDAMHHLMDALADLRRFWERPDRKRRFLAELGEPVELAVLRTLRAVEQCEAASGEEETHDPGVGAIADALAVDASTASRLVEQAVRGGYLSRQPGRVDRRRTRLELTTAGSTLLDTSTRIRRHWLAEITAGWSAEDVDALASLLRRFIDDATTSEDAHQ